jgi:hypothetical protein
VLACWNDVTGSGAVEHFFCRTFAAGGAPVAEESNVTGGYPLALGGGAAPKAIAVFEIPSGALVARQLVSR